MIHFSDIVGDCSGTVARGAFIPPPPQTHYGILHMLEDRYHMQIETTINHSVMYNPSMVSMEITMSEDNLKRFCDDIHTFWWGTPVTNLPQMTITPVDDGRPYIKCTAEQKENFIQMIERYCDTCFLGNCEAEDADDCRKCLERRVRWEIE